MTKTSRLQFILAGLAGGVVVLLAGALLLVTGMVGTGGGSTQIVQGPVPAAGADEGGDSESATVNQIYKRTGPGVVFIQARGVSDGQSPFGLPRPEGTATGSGFVLDREGFVLTNAHVVQGAESVRVRFGDRDTIDAEVVGSDLSSDLAVLKVDPDRARLRPLELGESKQVQVGDPAIAIGNPFGFDRTVTTGIVSALQRQIQAPNGFAIDNVLQTDASINPGNSGGPLLDGAGRVIGVNSQIATGGSNGSVGIGFAVPVDTVKTVVPQLMKDGKIERAYIGVTTAPVTREVAQDLNLARPDGALVQQIAPGSPASRAGLRAGRRQTEEDLVAGGDLIVGVDGKPVREPEDIQAAISDNKPGDRVEIDYFRGNNRSKTTVRLGNRPATLDMPDREGGGGPSPIP